MDRIIRALALGLVAVLLLAWGTLWLADEAGNPTAAAALRRVSTVFGYRQPAGNVAGMVPLGGVQIGGPFHLVDHSGTPVSEADYRGRWMLVYFGYTFCPDVCPTELQTIAAALDKLGADAPKVVPLFITVDPGRDTPEVLAKYVKLFDDRIVGLTGTPAQIADVARAFRVYYAKVTPKDDAPYVVDHSSFVYLMDPKGRLSALFSQDTSVDNLAAGIQERISQKS
jgi:cytochrome oxidase Cu insertion factor (SCO1/SenC/PrrC family)